MHQSSIIRSIVRFVQCIPIELRNSRDHAAKHTSLPHQVAQPSQPFDDALFSNYSYQQPQLQQYYDHQQSYAPMIDTSSYARPAQQPQFNYYAPSPTLSDLSSLSALSNSPLSPPHALTPISPLHQGTALGLGFIAEPTSSSNTMLLPPMPLDAHLDSQMPLSVSTSDLSPAPTSRFMSTLTPPALPSPTSATAPSTASTGPAPGEYAVLTLTGHTIAASSSYR